MSRHGEFRVLYKTHRSLTDEADIKTLRTIEAENPVITAASYKTRIIAGMQLSWVLTQNPVTCRCLEPPVLSLNQMPVSKTSKVLIHDRVLGGIFPTSVITPWSDGSRLFCSSLEKSQNGVSYSLWWKHIKQIDFLLVVEELRSHSTSGNMAASRQSWSCAGADSLLFDPHWSTYR